jgi:hypothetical protein
LLCHFFRLTDNSFISLQTSTFPIRRKQLFKKVSTQEKGFHGQFGVLLLIDSIYNPLFCLWFTRRFRQIMSWFLLNGRALLHVDAISYGRSVVAVFQARRRVRPYKGL